MSDERGIVDDVRLLRDGFKFWDFLTANHIQHDREHFPYLSKGNIPTVRRVYDFEEFLSLGSRGEALGYLYRGLGKSLNYVGPVLDLELPHGFNDHTDRHTLWVGQTGVELLARAGVGFDGKSKYDSRTEVLMTLVAMTHDLGNLFGRKLHSRYSVDLLKHMFGRGVEKKREWSAIEYAILYHEEPVLAAEGIKLTKGLPLQWALVAADKMHVGRERIGGRSFVSGIKNRAFDDPHILLNSLIVRSTWYMSSDHTFVWHLGFSVDQLEEKFGSFTRGNSRLWVPGWVQGLFVSQGIKYRDTFIRLFIQTYTDRLKMMTEAVFLLFDYIDKVEVRLGDIDTRGKVGSGEVRFWEKRRTGSRVKNDGNRSKQKAWWRRG